MFSNQKVVETTINKITHTTMPSMVWNLHGTLQKKQKDVVKVISLWLR
jgi:hypothetical protein